jgi:hypothetical protein
MSTRLYTAIVRRHGKHVEQAAAAATPAELVAEELRYLRSVAAMFDGDPAALAAIAGQLRACSEDIIAGQVGRMTDTEARL